MPTSVLREKWVGLYAVGSAFSGEQSDIAQVIGCDDEYRYLAQASTFDDSPAVALQVYEAIVGA